jgi:CheY-like chemotaxis protein
MTGLQLAEALHDQRPGLPVILFTAYGEGLSRTDLNTAGVSSVLRKPIDPRTLETALVAALGRSTESAPAA